jgi:hypothetical protein
MAICNRCKLEAGNNFHKRQSTCCDCRKELERLRYQSKRTEIRAKQHTYWHSNKKKIREYRRKYERERYHSDAMYRLSQIVRKRLQKIFNGSKSESTETLLGISFEKLLALLGDRPSADYHLDHICPLAQAQTEEELKRLCHYTNLQWLPSKTNASKAHHKTSMGVTICKSLLGRDWVDCIGGSNG